MHAHGHRPAPLPTAADTTRRGFQRGIEDAIWGALPYAAIMILFTLLILAVPQIVTWLPGKM